MKTDSLFYKLPQKSREEIAAMFSQVDLKQTRFYQEVFTEGRQEGRQEERKVLIQRLAARGMSAVEIAQIVDLPVKEVELTIAQINQFP